MNSVSQVDIGLAENIAKRIELSDSDILNIEDVQDMVERHLMDSRLKDVARSYVLYRNARADIRNRNRNIVDIVWERINAKNVKNSNANVDERSFSGREKEASSDVQKMIALEYVMSNDVAEACKDGLIYQHDLDKYNIGQHNCLQVDMQKLLTNGFRTRNGEVRPPRSLNTAFQLVAVIFQCQSQVQYGGVGSIHLDYDLAPFVKISFYKHFKDGLKYVENFNEDIDISEDLSITSYAYTQHEQAYKYAMDMLNREGLQGAQALFHNLNTLIMGA